jgi:hypothetical protein
LRRASLLIVALALGSTASAHPLGPSFLELHEQAPGSVVMRWRTPIAALPGHALTPNLPEGCEVRGGPRTSADPVARETRWELACPAGLGGRRITVRGIEPGRGVVLLRVRLADGRSFQRVLAPDVPVFAVPAHAGTFATALDYARLGVEHMLTGADHLAFVLGLVMLVPRPRQLLGVVTAFTAGHSVTLSLAALRVVRFPPAPIEALIAATILLLAIELARGTTAERSWLRRRPWTASFACGLLHGLGFAGALAELGLPASDIPLALGAFNLGIEVGQLAFIGGVLLVRPAVRRLPAPVAAVPPYALGSLAAYWLFTRLGAMG